jgi:hypothetical protein
MKLGKLSLAAIIALGSLSTASFAQPLEEAIKGVDASGYMRYRWTDRQTDAGNNATASDEDHEFKSGLTLKTPMTDSLQAVMNVTYKNGEDVDTAEEATNDTLQNDDFHVREFYMVYAPTATKTTALVGKRTIGSVLTDDAKANGIWVLNSDLPHTTLAAVYLTELDASDGDWTPAKSFYDASSSGTDVVAENDVIALAAIINYEPVALQVWYHDVEDVLSNVFVQGDISHTFSGVKLGLGAQYATSNLDDNVDTNRTNNVGVAGFAEMFGVDSDFFGVQATAAYDIFSGSIGYTAAESDVLTNFTPAAGAGTPVAVLSLEDHGAYYGAGELAKELIGQGGASYTNAFVDEVTAFYVTAKVDIPAVAGLSVGADYVNMENDRAANVNDVQIDEYVGRANYKVNKNWNFSTYYSVAEQDSSNNANSTDVDEFRVEVKYSF